MRSIFLAAVLLLGNAAQDRDVIFAQMDRFDPLDTKGLQFVRVTTGRRHWSGGDTFVRFGFLVKAEPPRFTVRFLDLTTETLEKSEKNGYEAQDMAARAKAVVAEFADSDSRDRYYFNPSQLMSPRAEALLLARAAARRGMNDEVEILWKALGRVDTALSDFAKGIERQIVVDFGDPAFSRIRLLERYREWLKEFPKDYSAKYVAQTIKALEPTVEQDRLGKAPDKNSIDGLVYALRDEYYPVRDHGIDGYFPQPRQPKPAEGTSTTERLIKQGHAAVPALVKAIGDETLTRCVWYHSRYGGNLMIFDVGDFAEGILREISGLRFYGKTEERRALWDGWSKTVSEKGEEAFLVEFVSKGDSGSSGAAERLMERYPARFDALIDGIRRMENRHNRKDYLNLLAKSKDEKVTEFLLAELKKGPYVDARVDAAQALLERGRTEGLEIFIAEWATAAHPRQKPQPGVPDAVQDFDQQIAVGDARSAMAGFLLRSGNLEAVKTAGRNVETQPVSIRDAIVGTFRGEDLKNFLDRSDAASRPVIEKELERMLVSLLDDKTVRTGSYGFSHKGKSASFNSPQNADFVACSLSSFWPERYPFDPAGTTRYRRIQIDAMKNIWRKSQGLPPIALPAPPDVRSKDPEVPRMVEQLLKKPGVETRQPIEAAGLGALPWIEDALKKADSNHPARKDLEGVANALCNIVRDVQIETEGWKAPDDLKAKLIAFKGKRATPEGVVELMLNAVNGLPTGNGRVVLEADRLADGAGILVVLKVVPHPGDAGNSVEHSHSGTAGGESIGLSWGSGVSDIYKKAEGFKDEATLARKALAVSHDQSFEFRIDLNFH